MKDEGLTKAETMERLSVLLFNRQRRSGSFAPGDQLVLQKNERRRWDVSIRRNGTYK